MRLGPALCAAACCLALCAGPLCAAQPTVPNAGISTQTLDALRNKRIALLDRRRTADSADDDAEAHACDVRIAALTAQIHRIEAALAGEPSGREDEKSALPQGLGLGLLSHYRFDRAQGRRIADCSGAERHGTAHGALPSEAGYRGGALWLDGLDDYALAPLPEPLTQPSPFTLALCVQRKPDESVNEGMPENILSIGTEEKADLWLWATPEGAVGVGWQSGKRGERECRMDAEPARLRLASGRWAHVALVFDGQVVSLYVDGRRDKTCPATSAPVLSPQGSIHLGRRHLGNWLYYFAGRIDDLALWNRALTEVEVIGLATALARQAGVADEAPHLSSQRR